jgi:copper transport protein
LTATARAGRLTAALVAGLLAALGSLAALLAVGPARPTSAHASLIGTAPAADEVLAAAPGTVDLRFDEPVETAGGAVEVFGPGGGRVDAGRVTTSEGGAVVSTDVAGDDQGTYTVAWRVTSADSHTLSGSFVYHVGTRTGAVDIAVAGGGSTTNDVAGGIGRWLGYAGTLVAVGAAALVLAADSAGPRARARLRTLAVGGGTAGAVGVLVMLVATLADSAGRGVGEVATLLADAPDGRTGRLALLRAGLLALAAAAAAVPALWRRSALPVVVAGTGALVVAALAGHAWTAPDRALAVAADTVHLGAAALWVGGLGALLVALPVASDRYQLTARFSALAVAAAIAVAVTGTVSGWQQVRTFDALTSTGYGQLLLAKVAGFAALIGLGWLNRSRLVPLVARTAAPLTRSLRAETAVAALVLALTAALVHQVPARATVTEDASAEATVTTEHGTLQASVVPARAGANDVHLWFLDLDGGPLDVDAVQVTAAPPDVPGRRLTVVPVSPSHVTAPGASLPAPGTWTVDVTAVRQGEPITFTLEVQIR